MKKKFYFEDRFYLSIYKANVTFAFGDFERYSKMLKEKCGLEKLVETGGHAIRFMPEDDEREEYVIWLPRINYGALAHEAVHLAGYIFGDRRIRTHPEGEDEPFAYLVEWLVENYLKTVKDFKGKKKK